jgi:phage protein GP46|nr:MAG TPA: hypothetical protein [Caudoviricetes sp.]
MIINIEELDISRVQDKVLQQILICIFTDAFIPEDELPEGIKENRGCWIDNTEFTINNKKQKINVGSRLWTLHLLPLTDETPRTAERYIEDCLQPLTSSGIVKDFQVVAERDKDRLNFMLSYNHKNITLKGF